MSHDSYVEDLLVRILKTPSPTGHTKDIISLLAEEAAKLGYQPTLTKKGGLLIQIPGADNQNRRFLTAHVDTLGGMVKEILENGRLRVHRIGGYTWNTVEGEYCQVLTESGQVLTGTIILHNTSVHVNREVGDIKRTDENMEIVLDAPVNTQQEALAFGVQVGDFVAWDPRVAITDTGYIKSRHLDDKASVAILFGVLRELQSSKYKLPYGLDIFISNNEEIGYGGNANIADEIVEYLAVDMGAIGDGLATDEHSVSICALDGSGPYHEGLRRHLVALAKANGLHYAVDIYPYYSSDASAALRAGADVRHGLIGPGVANSHAYERTHRDALKHTMALILAYIQSPLVS
ncbi:M42 family metallopeptidase [Alicyclobacillus suci]|uniref:M42 family metallopeptidase n=1 Tax=Alicyclobacillus suci TaxID=2816080 RepID=UPI001A8C7B64|nr:M42 family metallopeptidase [Alicyclobacillus suci]